MEKIIEMIEKDSAMYLLIPVAVADVLLLGVAFSMYLLR